MEGAGAGKLNDCLLAAGVERGIYMKGGRGEGKIHAGAQALGNPCRNL